MEKKIIDKPNYLVGITHSGKFHCDDVCCAALLRIIYPDIDIVRQPTLDCDPDNIKNTIVFDIGDGKYDHHGVDNQQARPNGIKYSSFGKLFRDFARYIPISKSLENYLDNILVQEIDKMDNGEGFSLFGAALTSYNLNWDEDASINEDKRFFEAVDVAQTIILNIINKKKADSSADKYIDDAIESQNSPIIILDKSVPIHNRLQDDILFIISPSLRGGYNLQPAKNTDGKYRRYIPHKLWSANPPEGLEYTQSNGGLAVFNTVYNAINAAQTIINDLSKDKFPSHVLRTIKHNNFEVFKSNTEESIKIEGIDILSNNKICAFRESASFYTLNPIEIIGDKLYIDTDVTFGIVDNRDKSDYIISAKEFNKNSKTVSIVQRILSNGNNYDIG